MSEKEIVIRTLNVLEVLSVEKTIVEDIIPRRIVTGYPRPIAVQVSFLICRCITLTNFILN